MTATLEESKIENFGSDDHEVKKFSFKNFKNFFKFKRKKIKEKNLNINLKKNEENDEDFPSGFGEHAKIYLDIDFPVNVSIAFNCGRIY